MNRVREHFAWAEETYPREVFDGTRAVVARDVFDLLARLRDVRDDERARPVGEGFDFAQVRFAHGVGRVRRYRGGDEAVPLPARDESLGVAHRVGPSLVVGDGKIDYGLAEQAAHARALGLFG